MIRAVAVAEKFVRHALAKFVNIPGRLCNKKTKVRIPDDGMLGSVDAPAAQVALLSE